MADSNPQAEAGEKKDKTCWQCGRTFKTAMDVCPDDGARLIETGFEDQEDPLLGTVFDGRFQILKKLGEGGMGTVYSAQRLDFETEVALKLLKLDFARDDGIRKRFMYEARVISNLKHPHAVRLFDFGQTSEGHVYMVMELLSGESLADRLAYRFVSYREVFDIITPVCGVLGEAHLRDVIHRDLKPENIYLLEVDGNEEFPKLLDFGIAKHKREETMTKSGTLWGTPAYMSPEQAQGNPVGAAADIYGIGIMLYELISGNLPFHASTQMGYAVKHINEPVRPLSSIPGLESVPEELDDFLVRMLAKAPEKRPESMEEVATTLSRICEECFDDELLDSVPAQEIDPIGLQRWINEAPDITGELESPINNLASTVVGETGDEKVQSSKSMAGDDGTDTSKRDITEMETLAAPPSDLLTKSRGERKQTRQMAGDEDAPEMEEPWARAALDLGGRIPPAALIGGLGIVLVFGGLMWALFSDPDDSTGVGTDLVVSPDLPMQAGEEVGTSSVPADGGNVVAVGASRALMVVFEAHGVVQAMQPDEMDGELEPDFEFLHDHPTDESEDEEDDSEELREALERTF